MQYIRLFLCSLILLLSLALQAEDKKFVTIDGNIAWHKMEALPTQEPNKTIVKISGQTQPNSIIYFHRKTAYLILEEREISFFPTKGLSLNNKSFTKSNSDGYFEMRLKLPWGLVQLPLALKLETQQKFYFNINLYVEDREAEQVTEETSVAKKKSKKKPFFKIQKHGIWFGTGLNYVQFDQDVANQSLSFKSLAGPSLFTKYWLLLPRRWELDFQIKNSPGETSSSNNITVTDSKYNWTTLTLYGTYFPKRKKRYYLFKYRTYLGYGFGVEHHLLPFLRRTTGNQSSVEVVKAQTTMLAGRVKALAYKKRWELEIYMGYQYPFTSSSEFEVKPSFTFDGSVGAAYKWNKNWKIGGYWYGQFHKFSHTSIDGFTNTSATGDSFLFFSNAEIRLGYKF